MKSLLLLLAFASTALAQLNLVPNWNFAAPTPLKSWRVDFSYQDSYPNNASFVKQATVEGKRCAVVELPTGTPEKQKAKIETALMPAVPGATYRAEVEALLTDSTAR